MNRILIEVSIGAALLAGLIFVARPSPQGVPSGELISNINALTVADASNYDFGSISMAAGKVSHEFILKNVSSETVILNKVYTSCMCTAALLRVSGQEFGPFGMLGHGSIPRLDKSLGTGEEVRVEVVFDPAAHGPAGVGKIQRAVTIENNSGQPVVLQVAAIVTP